MFLFLLFGTSAAESDTSRIQSVLNEAHQRFASVADGKNADYIPYLAGVDSNLFGLAVVTVDGTHRRGREVAMKSVIAGE